MERRALANDVHALVSRELESRGFLAAFTERTGGVSDRPYRSLNLGFRTGDRPEHVRRNRKRAIGSLGVSPFASARQVHGTTVRRVGPGRAGAGFDDPDSALPSADVLAVARPGLPVAVLVADCLPIVLASELEGGLAAIHAGWRGLAAGVLGKAVGLFRSPREVWAAIGPAIGPCHYEVGEDVAVAVTAGSETAAVTERRNGRLVLDLPRTAERALRSAGVSRIERSEECTACQEGRYFSYRREGTTGRQALVAVRL